MKNKRLKSLLIKCSYLFLCTTLVSCANFNNTTYINKSLLQANEFVENNKFDEAINLYTKILEKDSTNQKALFNKSLILKNQNNYKQSLIILDKITKNYPNNLKAYQVKIGIYKEDKNTEKVISTYNSLFSISPFLYSIRAEYLEFLVSGYQEGNTLLYSQINENSIFLLEENREIKTALKALCTIEKNNAEYAALLYLKDKKTWKEIYSPTLSN